MDENLLDHVPIWPENTAGIYRYIPQKERDSYDAADFAGPDRSFPITSQAQLEAAAHLIGHAADPAAVKAKAISIAKRKGFTLPKAWQEESSEKKDDGERAMKAETHPAFSGTHNHAHPAFGSQGDDDNHEHEHSHDNDADHHHEHNDSERAVQVTHISHDHTSAALTISDRTSLYMPIIRAVEDQGEWIVEGQATSDVVDDYLTIFDYESAKKAFERWRGNLREMHQRKAVGRSIKWTPNDALHTINLRARVSRGAPDTWTKVGDGTLNAFSLGLKPGFKTKYVERDGKSYLCYYDFDLAEVSLVDNPGSPKCDIAIVRANGDVTDILDTTDEGERSSTAIQAIATAEEERKSVAISSANRTKLHSIRDSTMQMCADAGCEECTAMASARDGDGADRAADTSIEHIVAAVVQALQPTIQRYQAIAGRFASIPDIQQPQTIDMSPITRALEVLETRIADVPTQSSLDEVRSVLTEVKGQVDRIAAQPAPGGPILNGAYPVEKRLATDPPRTYQNQPTHADLRAGLDRMQEQGDLQKQMDQLAAAALTLQRFQGRIGS